MSSYFSSLDLDSKKRYSNKLTVVIGGIEDPYTYKKEDSIKQDQKDLWPCVEYPDIYNYGEYGKMILCDNSNCAIQWFHIDCLKLPKGKWYCPMCTKGKQRKRQNKK